MKSLLKLIVWIREYFFSLSLMIIIITGVSVCRFWPTEWDAQRREKLTWQRVCAAVESIGEDAILREMSQLNHQDEDGMRNWREGILPQPVYAPKPESEMSRMAQLLGFSDRPTYHWIVLDDGTEIYTLTLGDHRKRCTVLFVSKFCSESKINIHQPHRWVTDRIAVLFCDTGYWDLKTWNYYSELGELNCTCNVPQVLNQADIGMDREGNPCPLNDGRIGGK